MLILAVVASASEPAVSAFAERVDQAKALYFAGDLPAALTELQRLQLEVLQRPDEQPWSEVAEALTYLGEIQIKLGDDRAARGVFRYLLEKDPTTPISPYHHPIEVVFLFDQVRDDVLAQRAAERLPPPPPPRTPWHAWLPLGLAQGAQGRTGAGVGWGLGHAALGGVAVGTYLHLDAVNVVEGHPLGWTPEQVASRVQVRRYALQWPAVAGFYGMWALSVSDAHRSWRRAHPAADLVVVPGAEGRAGLTVGGTF